jgi:hypothetical protein
MEPQDGTLQHIGLGTDRWLAVEQIRETVGDLINTFLRLH